jgi:hypothetical protein
VISAELLDSLALQVAAIAAGSVEAEPPVAAAIHSARDWPDGLPPMEAPVAVLAHDQPTSAICGVHRNQALSQMSPGPTVTHIMVHPFSPTHSLPAPTAPDFSENVSSESNTQLQGDSEDFDAHSATVQQQVTNKAQAVADEAQAVGLPEPESSNQPAETRYAAYSGENNLQQSNTDAVGPESQHKNEDSPIDGDSAEAMARQDKPTG